MKQWFSKERKNLTSVFIGGLIAFMLLGLLAGCAHTPATTTGTDGSAITVTETAEQRWEKAQTVVYLGMGTTIQVAQTLLPAAQLHLSSDQYALYSTLINETAPKVYGAVGTTLESVKSTIDVAKRKDAMATYETALSQLGPVMVDVIKAITAIQEAKKAAEGKT